MNEHMNEWPTMCSAWNRAIQSTLNSDRVVHKGSWNLMGR